MDDVKSDEIEMWMESNDTSTEVRIILRKKTAIELHELVLSLEEYLTELARAHNDRKQTDLTH